MGLAMIVIAAGLGTGLAIPEVLNNLHQTKKAPADSRSIAPPQAAPAKTALAPPILAVVDPSTLVEEKQPITDPESLRLPAISAALTIPAPRAPVTALEPASVPIQVMVQPEGQDFESEIFLPGWPQRGGHRNKRVTVLLRVSNWFRIIGKNGKRHLDSNQNELAPRTDCSYD